MYIFFSITCWWNKVAHYAISASHPTHTGLQGCVTWTCASSSLAHAHHLSFSSQLCSEFDRENLVPSLCAVKRLNRAVDDSIFQLVAVKHVNCIILATNKTSSMFSIQCLIYAYSRKHPQCPTFEMMASPLTVVHLCLSRRCPISNNLYAFRIEEGERTENREGIEAGAH